MNYSINAIGIIHSSFHDPRSGGRQPSIDGRKGQIRIFNQFVDGLEGLEEFSHIFALYYFHRQTEVRLKARPCFDPSTEHGIFASRYPTRPNPIGISVLTLNRIQGNILHCDDIDVIDGTPLLDIKPYVKQFDQMHDPVSGWYDQIDWEKGVGDKSKYK